MTRTLAVCMVVAILLCLSILPANAAEDANTLYQQALDLYYQGKLDDALAVCGKSLSLNPKASSSWNLKGMILDDLGKYQDALDAYNEAIRLKPTSYVAYNNKGNTLKHMLRYDEAVQAYDEALKINPSYTYAYYNKGNLLSLNGRYEEAIKSLDSAISYDPHYAEAWYSKGLVYQKMNLHQDAVFSFEKAIAEKAAYKEAYYAKGISLVKLGKEEDAVAAFSRVLELDPSHANAKNQLNAIGSQNYSLNHTDTEIPIGGGLSDPWPLYLAVIVIAVAGLGFLFFRFSPAMGSGKAPPTTGPPPHEMGEKRSPEKRPKGTGTPHDVFISYSSQDKYVADAVCASLESRNIRCWIAPRDLLPGIMYQEGIIRAIEESRIMVFIFSSHSNNSPHIVRELTKAVSSAVIIIPFRIEDVVPSKAMEYLIGAPHWLDALTPPLETHIQTLARTVESLLGEGEEPGNGKKQ
ncbi:MAG TPA: tetratricopeptide repeat protein [Methanolinea sp.]|nr:tetratricopeptide repeat protein [Methanolinea sp.]